jgi:hypothetical protein
MKPLLLVCVVAVALCPAANAISLINPSFEQPVFAPNSVNIVPDGTVPGWHTTESDHAIEIWHQFFNGVPAFDGTQFAELDANAEGTLYQDVTGIAAGQVLTFHFAHRGRVTVESMQLDITDLGADGIYGTGDDHVLFSKAYADGTSAWGFYTSATEAPIVALGNNIRFSYVSLVPGSVGNFLDDADFGVGVSTENPNDSVPEPATLTLVGLGLAAWIRRKTA